MKTLNLTFLVLYSISYSLMAQNTVIESFSENKFKYKNGHGIPLKEFKPSLKDKYVSPFMGKQSTKNPYPRSRKVLSGKNINQTNADSVWRAWVKHFGPEVEPVFNRAFDLTIDRSGNTYVTGSSDNDYITIKYDTSGTQQWIKFYAGPGKYCNDIATTIISDGAGNIYVSGYSDEGEAGYDYVTIKYDSAGNEKWVARYQTEATFYWGYDRIFMTVDSLGNVYIASANDRTLIKYNAEGVEQWARQASKSISVHDMAIDHAGYVYLVGDWWDKVSDHVTIVKYNSTGQELWLADDNDIYFENSSAIAVDQSGNVYMAGYGMFNSNVNYIILKYDSSGIKQWTVNYNGQGDTEDYANDINLDKNGNVYVTGQSGSGSATIKYNPSGIEQWISRYDGMNSQKIAVDLNGNVFVAGFCSQSGNNDYVTMMYNAAGEEQWNKVYSGLDSSYDYFEAMKVDGKGAVYVTGFSLGRNLDYQNCVTLKYDTSGNVRWVGMYDGPKNSYAGAKAVDVDQAGNVYVTGGAYDTGMVTIKYSPTGEELWKACHYDGWARDIAVDASGNVYITGRGTIEGLNSPAYITIKYNLNGIEQWITRYGGPAGYDEVAALALDNVGNVYVTGSSWGGSDTLSEEYATVKYNPSGIEQWVARYKGTSISSDQASAIAVDTQGNVYVTGVSWSSSTSSNSGDYATIKYDKYGVEQWVAKYNGPGNSNDNATALAVDVNGNIYVTGSSDSIGSGLDYTTIKYNPSGVEQWIVRYNGSANQNDAANAIGIDRTGNVYVTGYSTGSDSSSDYTTIKYNPDGKEQWVARYNGPVNGIDEAVALKIGSLGNIYVTGKSEGLETLFDIVTIKYDPEGNQKWIARFNEADTPDNYATDMAVDANETVYVGGYSGSEKIRFGYAVYIGIGNRSSVYTVIKYSNEPVSVRVSGSGISVSYRLEQNYPNPFNPTTTIKYSVPASPLSQKGDQGGFITLKVYNLLGQEVATVFEGMRQPGNYDVLFDGSNLASGVYIYRFQAGDFIMSKKLILMK